MFSKIGIKPQVFKSGRLKDGLSPGRQPTDEECSCSKDMVNEMFDSFTEIVSEGRKIPLEEVKASPIGDARIMLLNKHLN